GTRTRARRSHRANRNPNPPNMADRPTLRGRKVRRTYPTDGEESHGHPVASSGRGAAGGKCSRTPGCSSLFHTHEPGNPETRTRQDSGSLSSTLPDPSNRQLDRLHK